ncbi:helix-turn-helix transcriptional regulator [Bacillus manliponensis]|uniref:helix-turn-helix transcriptional regulator n=1 Tax=Bacillus manliponensis TaxID=574376 RepID=UPI003516BD07
MKNRIKELRLKSGITQQELADKVCVSSRTIISLEKQKYNPSVLLAYRISLVFNLSIEEVFIFEPDDLE